MTQSALHFGSWEATATKETDGGSPVALAERTVPQALLADMRSISGWPLLALLTVPTVIFFEWGFGNDFTNVYLIASAYESGNGIFAVSRAIVAGFFVPLVLQLLGGIVASTGFSALRHTTTTLRRRLSRRSERLGDLTYSKLSFVDKWWVSVALGTTAAVLLEQGRPPPQHAVDSRGEMLPVIVISALFMALTTSVVAGICAAALELANAFETLTPFANNLVEVLTNPVAWIALFIFIGLIRAISSWLGGAHSDE